MIHNPGRIEKSEKCSRHKISARDSPPLISGLNYWVLLFVIE